MKILLRAPASPRAARPPRPTSVPIKHRNRKNSGLKPNFFIINSNYYFGRRPDPVTTSNLKKNPVTASGITWETPRKHRTPAHAVQGTTRPQTYPGASPRADLHPKKVNNLGPMAPRSRKKRKLPEPPSSRRSGLVGPYTTPPIVNYKYRTSTRREGYFGLPTLGS